MTSIRATAVFLSLCAACSIPTDPQADELAKKANDALRGRAYHEALSLVDSALALNRRHLDAQFIRGRLFFELGQMANSQYAYESLIKWAPDYPGAHHNLGNAFFGQRQYHLALAHFRRESAAQPAPNSWHAMGATFEQMALSDSARIAYQKAISIDAEYAPAYASLAELFEREARYEDALAHAERALDLQPDRARYRYLVGLALFRLERFEEAESHLNHAAMARPWDYSALYTLGQTLQRMGRSSEAQQVLTTANDVRAAEQQVERLGTNAREQPTNFQHQLNYANALRNAGRLDEAIDGYLIGLALRPSNLELQNNIATAFMQVGDTAQAMTRYRHILAQDSTFVVTWINIGWHYANTNRMQQAVQSWATAARHGPDHPTVMALKAALQRADSARSSPEP